MYKVQYVGASKASFHVKDKKEWKLVSLFNGESAITEEISPQIQNLVNLEELKLIPVKTVRDNFGNQIITTRVTEKSKVMVGFGKEARQLECNLHPVYVPPVNLDDYKELENMPTDITKIKPTATASTPIEPLSPPPAPDLIVDNKKKVKLKEEEFKEENKDKKES